MSEAGAKPLAAPGFLTDHPPPGRFVGGKLNVCHNAVDRHVESGRGEQAAIIYDSPVTGHKEVVTFRQLQEQVSPQSVQFFLAEL